MSKQQLIEQILEKTSGIPAGFLETFSEPALKLYLRRLTTVRGNRGKGSVWVRKTGSPAIATKGQL